MTNEQVCGTTMTAINRQMKMYVYEDDTSREAKVSAEYTFSTLVQEQQIADDIAKTMNFRQGEGHWTVFDIDGDVLKKLDFPL